MFASIEKEIVPDFRFTVLELRECKKIDDRLRESNSYSK